ncbi:MYND domain protein [Apiospora saccharicola]
MATNKLPDPWREYRFLHTGGDYFAKRDPGKTLEQLDSRVDTLCIMCDEPNALNCGRCRAPYCSVKCQTEDWPFHKAICRDMIGDLAPSQRPGSAAHRMLLFSPTKAHPELIWATATTSLTSLGGFSQPHRIRSIGEILLVEALTSREITTCVETETPINYSIPFRKCGHGLYMRSLNFGMEPVQDAVISQSMMSLSPTPGLAKIQYNSVIVYAATPNMGSGGRNMRDVTARDLRSIVDFFQCMKPNPCILNPSRYPTGYYDCQMWPAVKVNCDGDIERFRRFMPSGEELPRFQQVTIPSMALESCRFGILWAAVLGLPWEFSKPFTNECLDVNQKTNTASKWFCGALAPKFPEGVTNIVCWSNEKSVGTVIVNHKLGAPIHPLHVRWLGTWKEDSDKAWDEPDESSFSDRDRFGMAEALLGGRTKDTRWTGAIDKAKNHWTAFVEKNQHDPDAANIVSPWDI